MEHCKLILTTLHLLVLIVYAYLCSLSAFGWVLPSFFCSFTLPKNFETQRGPRNQGAAFYRCQNYLRGDTLIKVRQHWVKELKGRLLIVPCRFLNIKTNMGNFSFSYNTQFQSLFRRAISVLQGRWFESRLHCLLALWSWASSFISIVSVT